ncbi:methionyl-tRNA formyltransferase [Patescibacteria group bacterium]
MEKICQDIKIIFMGTPEFGAIILEMLCQTEFKPVLVITTPDKPVGRKQILTSPPTKISAKKYKIPVIQPEILANSKSEILNSKPDIIVVASFGQILPKEILEIPKHGTLNVHPSLLPKYRGASPVQHTILNGDKETGITVMLMDEKMDHGKIISTVEYHIPNKINYKKLKEKLANLGSELLIKTIPKWMAGEIKPVEQDHLKATFTKILKKEDGKINWQKPAEFIERKVRALDPWPGTWTIWQKSNNKTQRIKILKTRILNSRYPKTYPIGKVLVAPQNEVCIQTGNGFLVIEKLQLEGKNITNSEEFLRGHQDFIGTVLK